jgi:PAS domain S-box-containing protein
LKVVETYQKELSQIKIILKNNPKGMTVTDIAHEIKINRNSVAKYLDVLLISGQAEMVTFGPAKVYFPSTRVPLSMILNFTHDYILLLNRELQIVQANENLINVLGINRDDIIGRSIDTFTPLFFQIPEIAQNSHQALNGKTVTVEKQYTENNHTLYLVIQHIPTTYDDGEPGVTLIIEDITSQREAEATRRRVTQEWDITFNAITDMVFIRDNDHTIIRANQAFADFLHLTPEECIGKKCYHLLHGSPESPASCPCLQAHDKKQSVTLEFLEPHLNSYLAMSAYPFLNENGDITGSVQIMKAIAEPEKKDR